jgi:hypothetical protein
MICVVNYNGYFYERSTGRVLAEFTAYRSVDVQKMNDLAMYNYVEVSIHK